ncbi:MAG: TonB-dependent receptor [Bacteroidetes bacterium]|nr:TonB-dependent receptor [Bacteroidota bacterium]
MKNLKIKLIFLFVLFCFFQNKIYSQQITGAVFLEGEGTPVEFANLMLKPGKQGTVSDRNGQFVFSDIKEGKYNLTVSMVGFVSKTLSINVLNKESINFNIYLVSDTKKIDEVRVLGNFRQKELLKNPTLEQASILTSITTISDVEMKKQGAVTLIDALKYVPGGWTETRGRKVKQFFSIRGQKYPYPSYSINGIWQKEFHEMPYFFNSSNIEEVKIIRSSSALLKSLSALTGVIDVTTKQPVDKEVDLFFKYGSLNTYHAGASFGNSSDKFKYRAGVNGLGTSGPEGRNGKENIWNAHGFAQYKFSQTVDLSVNLFYLNGMRQLVQPIEPADPKFINRKEVYDPINTLMISSKLSFKPSDNYSSELQINYAGRDLTYENENLINDKITKYKESDTEITLNNINAVALGSKNTLRFGALYNYWLAPEGKRFYYGRKGEVHTISGVITDQHNFGKLLLDGGFRLSNEYFEEWGGFSIEGSGGKFTNVEPIVDEWQSPVWQATSGVTYSISPFTSLHVSIAGGIVNPRKGALNNSGETPDNETRFNYNIGLVKNFYRLGKFTVATFWVNRKNAIDYSGNIIENGDDDIMELYKNVSKRNYGIEAEFKSAVILNTLTFFTNFTYMKGEIEGDSDWKKDDEMPGIIANMGANYFKNRVDVNAFLNYTETYKNDRFVSKDYLAENGKAPLGNFVTFDLTAGYRIGKEQKIRMYVEGKNMFNVKYQTVPGYPDNGRLVSAGVSLTL